MNVGRIFTGSDVAQDLVLTCDVCVVGSGAGGAVLAHELCARGLSVVMLEEGGYRTRADFDMREDTAYPNLYQELGNRTSDDLALTILQGRTVGGGTTVNWCSSFRTPGHVLDHWRDVHGVEGLTEKALTPHWEAIEQRLHIEEWPLERINRNNQMLWDGLGALGYGRGLIRRNVNKCANLGYCGLGCPIDAKQSMLVTYLPDAVEMGLSLYANVSARDLITSGRRVVEVRGEVLHPQTDAPTGRFVRVKPKVAVASCGAINSPGLLLRSDLAGEGQVGKRTFVHPVVATAALFPETVEAFYGAPQSVYSHHFSDRGPGKLGFFIEVPPVHPMLAGVMTGGFGPSHQDFLRQLPNLNACIALVVDGFMDWEQGATVGLRGKGYGRYRISYDFKEAHEEAFRAATMELARIQLAAGAREVRTLHAEPVVLRSMADLTKLNEASFAPLSMRILTAHQMGGCAMGRDPKRSVVDSTLRYHQLDNLFVVDGSVFPTSLGVNPQESIFGIARWAAQHVAAAV